MKKRFLAIFIVVMMLFSQITVFASVPDSSTTSINPEDKLTDELKEVMSNTPDGEYIPIYIWLNDDYSDELVYAHLSNKLGEEINDLNESAYISKRIEEKVEQYKTKQFSTQQRSAILSMQSAFENLSVESKISSLRNNADLSSIVTNEEIKNCLIDGKSFEDIIELSERYQYLSDYRDSRVAINETINKQFERKLGKENCKDVMVDVLLPYIEMESKNEYLLTLASINEVYEIGYLDFDYCEFVEETVYTNNETTDEYIFKPYDTDYTGNGIRVGVIDGLAYDPNANHLKTANITNMVNATANYCTHSTAVLSILCGQLVELDGIQYQGVAPDASIFFVRAPNIYWDLRQLHWLIVEKDVVVINISLQFGTNSYDYNFYERYLDCLVNQYRTVIVKSAGNGSAITSPGMAYNIITVGNISNVRDANNKWIVNNDASSYDEAEYLTNKPDISAFGTNICMVYGNVKTNFTSGTSLSAPVVTGTVALMMEANNELIGKPDAVKAILVNSADGEIVSQGNIMQDENGNSVTNEDGQVVYENEIVSTFDITTNSTWQGTIFSQIREKSGAGLLNIEGAISMVQSNVLYRFAMGRSSALGYNTKTIGEFYITAGKTIEFTLVFEKPFDNLIESLEDVNFDFEIELYKGTTKIMNSSSNVNNVESFRVTIPETGYYSFVIKCEKLDYAEDIDWNFHSSSGSEEPHISHDWFYTTFVLSCGCDLPSMIESGCYSEGHDIECENCTFTCFEPHKVASLTQTNSYATVTYEIKYKFEQPIEGYGNMERVCYYGLSVTVTPKSSNYVGNSVIETGYSETQPDGTTIETRTYWIIITNPLTSEIIYSYYSTINYMYDPYDGAYYLY